jgi:hypothetical protein
LDAAKQGWGDVFHPALTREPLQLAGEFFDFSTQGNPFLLEVLGSLELAGVWNHDG